MNTDCCCCICLIDEGILINPCKCKGTISYHESCVIEFIMENKSFECPNCKSKYTSVFIDKLQNFTKLCIDNHIQKLSNEKIRKRREKAREDQECAFIGIISLFIVIPILVLLLIINKNLK